MAYVRITCAKHEAEKLKIFPAQQIDWEFLWDAGTIHLLDALVLSHVSSRI
jgi:hypothetical protein